jgi:hypothetical protein
MNKDKRRLSLQPSLSLEGGYPCVPAAVTPNGHFSWKLMCFSNKKFCKEVLQMLRCIQGD